MNAVIPLCQHMFSPGRTCGSPAMRGASFCYYHRQNRRPRGPAVIPELTSRRNIQRAISNILQLTISGKLSSEDAGRMINGIAVAMSAMKAAEKHTRFGAHY
jgi:hypothetical protein